MTYSNWKGNDLKGWWTFSVKLDGIQAKKIDGKIVTKNGKPLYNIPDDGRDWKVAEIYTGNRGQTWGIISASKSPRRQIKQTEIYPLFPHISPVIMLGFYKDPSAEFIKEKFKKAEKAGYEGIVLRGGTTEDPVLIKVKKSYSDDVKIVAYVEGKGKFKGMLGKFITEMGEVGTGFKTAQRKAFWRNRKKLVGTMIEVLAQEKSKNGKMIDPRFIRLREDK